MPYEWHSFLWAADEWIINYSLPPILNTVKFFSIGQALELYLKAASSKITGDVNRAVKFGHDLPRIWADCKAKDSTFLPGYELRKTVLAKNLLSCRDYEQLNKDDLRHFFHHQELYVVAKYLADLKYLGAPLKKIKGQYALAFHFPNPMWADIFKKFRKFLGHPNPGRLDVIRHHLEEGHLPPTSTKFLKEIVVI